MRIEKVVAGVDFSPPAVDAARWVAEHFAPDAELTLVHVVDLPHPPRFLKESARDAEVLAEASRLSAERRLAETAALVASRPIRTEVRVGRAHEEITALAYDIGADLVAAGPHGDRPRSWKRLGTTAERLVRAAAPAVLVVGGAPVRAPVRMLVAIDDGPVSTAVLAWAKDLAIEFGAEVTVLHVVEQPAARHAPAGGASEPVPARALGAEELDEGRKWLDSFVGEGIGPDHPRTVVTAGHAGDAILAMARETGAELIVMGRRGTGALIPAVLGSTVSTVLHGARCPVLVITEEERDWIVDEGEG